ncbi:hypothetical protein AZI86_00740 [Bdellovibrio bacteriovorus]|uniref:Uncharacterized protein n=1 Tax=Bdellovibrio bacteriovorus TaxID=959 RepID=A0A150WML9_BDEBC|nr:hypothetical protein [Bdellovibrio bacteriovorus]KYG65638.1 hypothetical protein AZI86_00740 [Bdellovibrio bacteriovorus]
MRNKKLWVNIAVFTLLILSGFLFWLLRKPVGRGGDSHPRISRAEIDNILVLSKATFGYPKMLDDEVRAEDARITAKDEFEVLVTLVKIESTSASAHAQVESAKSRLPAYACDIRQLRFLLYKGITVLLTFKSNDQVDLFQYQITPEMCGE